jgi:hypothetical protein
MSEADMQLLTSLYAPLASPVSSPDFYSTSGCWPGPNRGPCDAITHHCIAPTGQVCSLVIADGSSQEAIKSYKTLIGCT